jgi:hypothetical protein
MFPVLQRQDVDGKWDTGILPCRRYGTSFDAVRCCELTRYRTYATMIRCDRVLTRIKSRWDFKSNVNSKCRQPCQTYTTFDRLPGVFQTAESPVYHPNTKPDARVSLRSPGSRSMPPRDHGSPAFRGCRQRSEELRRSMSSFPPDIDDIRSVHSHLSLSAMVPLDIKTMTLLRQ